MDHRGGCCIARYNGGFTTTSAHDLSKVSKVERIMLRFRPIAPKPTSATNSGSNSGGTSPEKASLATTSSNNVTEVYSAAGRPKRRYSRDQSSTSSSNGKKNNIPKKRKAVSAEVAKDGQIKGHVHKNIVTLDLLPEKPVRQVEHYRQAERPILSMGGTNSAFFMPILKNNGNNDRVVMESSLLMAPQPIRPVGSCVVVECINTCQDDIQELGMTSDVEKMNRLENDACPCFISDAVNNVTWTNEAYSKLVSKDGIGEARPEMVWLVTKEKLLGVKEAVFACRVRVQYMAKKERHNLTVPCDVWRLGSEGFAWRLDVKAALSLGSMKN